MCNIIEVYIILKICGTLTSKNTEKSWSAYRLIQHTYSTMADHINTLPQVQIQPEAFINSLHKFYTSGTDQLIITFSPWHLEFDNGLVQIQVLVLITTRLRTTYKQVYALKV